MKRPTSSQPCAIGARVHDTREATRDVFGDAAVREVLASVDPAVRAVFVEGARVEDWIAEDTYVAWMGAVYTGPCGQDEEAFRRWVDRLTDRGFGTARRMLMSLASPWVILRRAHALWRGEHTHGELSVAPLDASEVAPGTSAARFTLRDHPFTRGAASRLGISEAYRHIVYRCRVRWAREAHEEGPGGSLLVVVTWA